MEDSLYHSGSTQENRDVHARSLREGTEYIWGTNCKSVKGAEKPNQVQKHLGDELQQEAATIPRAEATKGGDAATRFQEQGLPSENWFHIRVYLAGADHGGRGPPAGAGTTEMILCKQKEAKQGEGEHDFSPSHFPSHPQVEPNLKLAGKGAWKM